MDSYLDNFLTEDEIVDKIIEKCAKEYHLQGDYDYLHVTWQKSWIYAPLLDDVRPFFEQCPYPIYVITNDGEKYIRKSMEENGLPDAKEVADRTEGKSVQLIRHEVGDIEDARERLGRILGNAE